MERRLAMAAACVAALTCSCNNVSNADSQRYMRWKSAWQADERVVNDIISVEPGAAPSAYQQACSDAIRQWNHAASVVSKAPTRDLYDVTRAHYVAVGALLQACARGQLKKEAGLQPNIGRTAAAVDERMREADKHFGVDG